MVLASSLIPGNENSVYRVINGLSRLGAKVVHKGNALVHVSGHASAGELLYCYNIVQPRNVMPVHGEARHLRRQRRPGGVHRRPARADDRRRGRRRRRPAGRPGPVVGKVDAGYIFVDGTTVGRHLRGLAHRPPDPGRGGLHLRRRGGQHPAAKVISGPDIHARGFVEGDTIFDRIRPRITKALEDALAEGIDDTYRLQQVIRRRMGRWVNDTHRRRPDDRPGRRPDLTWPVGFTPSVWLRRSGWGAVGFPRLRGKPPLRPPNSVGEVTAFWVKWQLGPRKKGPTGRRIPLWSGWGQRVTLPALMQEVQALTRLGVPDTAARTRWMFGSQRRLVFFFDQGTLWPKPGPLPQTSHTADTETSPTYSDWFVALLGNRSRIPDLGARTRIVGARCIVGAGP